MQILIETCGTPLLAIISTLTLSLSGVALALVFKRQTSTLAAFLPLAFLPAFIATAYTLLGFIAAIGLQTAENAPEYDSALLLSMNLVPLLLGLIASAIPASICAAGCLYVSLGGLVAMPKKEPAQREGGFDPEAWANKEADDYVNQIARPR